MKKLAPLFALYFAQGLPFGVLFSLLGSAGSGLIAVTCLEHLAGGAITTVVFALMMRHTDRQIGATHYTLLASLEVLGKLPPATLSGVLATRVGYPALFAIGGILCVAFALLAQVLSGRLSQAAEQT